MYCKYIKRFLDIFLCSFALIVLSPIFLITAIAIKISSPGPVFYYSVRTGKEKKPFHFYKFRSMHPVSEKYKQKDLYTADEDRLFFVGRLIRRCKIDELPQLINVIKGDMSIVGPRPMPVSSVDQTYYGKYQQVLQIKPGLTSVASLFDYVVGDTYTDEEAYRREVLPYKLEMELLYAQRQSFIYDAWLVLRTMWTIILVLAGCKNFKEPPELKEVKTYAQVEERV